MNKKHLAVILSILSLTYLGPQASAEAIPPDLLVKNTANEVLEIIKADPDVAHSDMNKIGKIVEEKIATKFDFDRMSQMVLGRSWKTASKSDQDQFIKEFKSLLVRTYSSALSKYKNQAIEYRPLKLDPSAVEVKVKTQILQPGSTAIPLEYSMEKVGDTWKVFDVVIDGVSLVTTYRGQFSEEAKQNGVNGVTQKLADKNNK